MAYGIRLGMFTVVRWGSLRAYFLAVLFAVYRQIVLFIVGLAARIAVLLYFIMNKVGESNPFRGSFRAF
jgi:hypothetical protein